MVLFLPLGFFWDRKKKTNCLLNAESHCRPLYFKICVLGLFEMESVFFFFFFSTVNEKKEKSVCKLYFTFFFCYCH